MASVQNNILQLRKTSVADLETLFFYQRDEEYNRMAAFTKDHTDRSAYLEKWTRLLADSSINSQSIMCNGELVGSVLTWLMDGETQISYGIGRPFWGCGLATSALQAFLEQVRYRPIYGRVAFDNLGSQRVLEKCGFLRTGTEQGFANARQQEIEEFVYTLTL
jgi:RimJ/RimL family protein N-acetyltransferase